MSKKQVQPPEKQPEAATDQVTIVGIGASAGGLEALRAMLPNLPTEANLAFIIVQHLDPTHRSMLTTLLARYTELEVIEVVNGDTVEAHKVYITPSGKDITIRNGRLHLSEPAAEVGPKPSIDQFLTSLAEDQIERSVGVILSGTGSDGAHGMRAIKAEGGITVVQSEESARYTGMPRAAIQTGLIDLILPPEKIGPELIEILKYPQVTPEAAVETVPGDSLPTIFHLLLDRTGCDFSDYKLSTIRRRIERRMAVHKLTDLQEYTLYLERSPAEVELLFKDILISVTSFFRDPDAFRGLRKVLRKIIDNKKVSEDIRIWVPGCATGEEAYSIAILLAEELGEHINRYNIQIFGTDIDLDAISLARRGVYPEAVVIDMDRPLRDRYFVREDSSFRVIKLIREMVIFSRQDLTKDPPFSRLDLITCRNVLIYFNNILQISGAIAST
jgi:two-component system CheB/CheR fusion protein